MREKWPNYRFVRGAGLGSCCLRPLLYGMAPASMAQNQENICSYIREVYYLCRNVQEPEYPYMTG